MKVAVGRRLGVAFSAIATGGAALSETRCVFPLFGPLLQRSDPARSGVFHGAHENCEGKAVSINVRRARSSDLDFVVRVMLTAAKSHLEKCVYEVLFDLDMSPS